MKDYDYFQQQKRNGWKQSEPAMEVLGKHLLNILENNNKVKETITQLFQVCNEKFILLLARGADT